MDRLRTALFAVASLIAAAGATRAQTVTWGGGFPNDNFGTATNWVGGTLPFNNGTETLQFTGNSDSFLNLNVPGDFLGVSVVLDTSGDNVYVDVGGGNSLTLGVGGVSVVSNGTVGNGLTFDAPVVLSANQTWSAVQNQYGYIQANGAISGGYGLTLSGDASSETFVLNSGSSTFSGGVTLSVTSSGGYYSNYTALVIGASSIGPAGAPTAGPVGTGTLTLGDGTTLTTSNSNALTLANALTIGNNTNGHSIVIGGTTNQFNPDSINLTLTGPVSLVPNTAINPDNMDIEVEIGAFSEVTFTGNLTGSSSNVCLDFGSTTYVDPIAIVQGNIASVNRLDLEDNVSVILDGPAGVSQVSTVSDIGTQPSTYLGLGSTSPSSGYAISGNVTAFLSYLHTTGSDVNFMGTLGFDTVSGSVVTYGDPVDLTNFTNPSFVGLGSATQAILAGAITPPGGASGTNYPFGGGGGMLTVANSLADGTGGPTSITLSGGNAPLTLVLSGGLSYTGGTNVNGAALIFNTPPSSSGSVVLGNGYIGATTASGYSDSNSNIQSFINLVSFEGSEGVIGFDSLTGTQAVASEITMPAGAYLGTATSVVYSGTIIPAGSQYRFSGVKGGFVVVSSMLSGSNSVAVGLPDPLETFSQSLGFETISSVTLSGNNGYSGGTTLNSGYLYVTNNNSIGSGILSVPLDSGRGWAASLVASGSAVALSNSINISDGGLALNFLSPYTLTLSGDITPFGTDNGTLGIYGPVDLEGNNTYSNGTFINVPASTPITIGSDSGLGTGPVNANGGTFSFTSAAPILNSSDNSQGVSFYDSAVTFNGSPVIYELQLAESTLNFNGATATINGFGGDSPGSGNVINLGVDTVLTFDTDYGGNDNGGTYHGIIAGATGSLVVTNSGEGNGSLNLAGANSYGGGTTIENGAVVIASNNSALGTGAVTVNGGGLVTNTGVTITNPVTLVGGSEENISGLAGYGTFSPGGTITFQNYGVVDPGRTAIGGGGNSSLAIPVAGTLSFGGATSLNFGPGGAYIFALTDANGAAGTGYSTVNIESPGALTISATMSNPFYINIYSFDPSTNQSGNALNFNPANSYSWTLLTSTSPITGFNSSSFSFITTHFTNSLGSGSFFVSVSGDDLTLNFTPVPEPSTWALMASGICAVAAAVRRRRR